MENDFLNGMFEDNFGLPAEEIHDAYLFAHKSGHGPEFLVELISSAMDSARTCEAKGIGRKQCLRGLITDVMFRIGVYKSFNPKNHEQTK